MSSVLNLILTHQPADAVTRMVEYWTRCVPRESILIAYGGEKSQFDQIRHDQNLFIDDPRLRTRDHQREIQSYTRLFQLAGTVLNSTSQEFQFVHFVEYDHVPLVPDLNQRQIERLAAEGADVLGFHLDRVDDTSSAHFLYHVTDERFMTYWARITQRAEPEVVLSMFGTGSFWTREAFCAVCAMEEPFPIYMELYLPTLAHHLGFRVRDFGEQNRFVRALPKEICSIEQARKEGAWTLHPLKRMWEK